MEEENKKEEEKKIISRNMIALHGDPFSLTFSSSSLPLNWCFTPSQPVRLYQGTITMMIKKDVSPDKKKQKMGREEERIRKRRHRWDQM